jgi:hypothetical protein
MSVDDFSALVQIIGSLLVLIPFLLVQLGRLRPESLAYIILNLVGSTSLALEALHGHQWGFLLLEGTWALASFVALLSRGRVARP